MEGIGRRRVLTLAGAGGAVWLAGACGVRPAAPPPPPVLHAAPVQLDLAGRTATTWGYNGTVPGPELRLRQGERLRADLRNGLPEDTTVHWHGVALVNAMDGVAGTTQPPVRPGEAFDYDFVVPDAGTYWYHAHVGHQLDRGLYGPLIVEPAREELAYDREYTLMLDDWRDGVDDAHASHPTAPEADGSGVGEVSFGGRRYPLLLVNGRPADDPAVLDVVRGERVRLRVVNAAADTGFRFAVAGHRLTVTHADGMAVAPVTVDALRLGMGERYDVLFDASHPGAWQLAVLPEGKLGLGRAVLRYRGDSAATPPAAARPAELDGRLLDYADLVATEPDVAGATPDRSYRLELSGTEILGAGGDPLPVAAGERVRIALRNTSAKWHPMHLHGHHARLVRPDGRGPAKDTVNVAAHGGEVTLDLLADNPGRWLLHCHNHYHMEQGMVRTVEYVV